MCQAIGSDHACTYAEIVAAENSGQLESLPLGLEIWLNRIDTPVTVGEVLSPAGAGGTCLDWTYPSGPLAEGEYGVVQEAGLEFFFDTDTTYDGQSGHLQGGLGCIFPRAIMCCSTLPRENRYFEDGFEEQCVPDTVEACYEGPSETLDVGTCTAGTRTCSAQGTWGPCTNSVEPEDEICVDGQDNNCNGDVDESCGLACDPLNLNSCNADPNVSACFVDIFAETAFCSDSSEDKELNEACLFLDSCAPGLSCIKYNENFSGLECALLCDPLTGQTPQGGTCGEILQRSDCVPLNEYHPRNISSVGICVE